MNQRNITKTRWFESLKGLTEVYQDNLMRLIGFVIYEYVVLLLHNNLPNGRVAQFLHDPKKKLEYEHDPLSVEPLFLS